MESVQLIQLDPFIVSTLREKKNRENLFSFFLLDLFFVGGAHVNV